MDKRVYLFMVVSFIAGLAELIIVGLLDVIADDIGVSLSAAGLLITAFSLTFAVAAPVLMVATAAVERKRLMLTTLSIFFVGNVLAALSHTYWLLMTARIISAASGSLLVVLCITMASTITAPPHRGRAIGLIYMGISASLVLGVPIGIMMGNIFGWQAPFVAISCFTVMTMLGILVLMPSVHVHDTPSIQTQWQSLKNSRLLAAHLTTFLFLAGHYTLYGYLSPYLKNVLELNETWVTIIYWLFGIAAVAGGAVGGGLSDKWGYKQTIYSVIVLFAVSMFVLPFTTTATTFFLLTVMIWGAMSWALSPPMQTYLAETYHKTSDIQQSLNNAALHTGIAFGSVSGGLVVEQGAIHHTPTVGALLVLLALGTAVYALAKTSTASYQHSSL
ncbi:MFS transporter, DHA1 family, purine base/nucleoside efflux pump [Alteribacillus persepolensis]|uniref:MFS transporter, DHA1 family, purine base/nucleoside efflux pump n=1 Tax=Alteribacillus persepolensis TaxID=568899 RepID=A0A1G8B3R7_9BACI|nr:MFS transporter [Alteribacillus persepolensis]SDH27837.1 MFS transporter, DHA1 family, purine base/nucleoside efflux pump [Alteribacillus persepolensis]